MCTYFARLAGLSMIISVVFGAPRAFAQDASSADAGGAAPAEGADAGQEAPPAGVTPEELEALKSAMGKDVQAQQKQGPAAGVGVAPPPSNPAAELAPAASNAPGVSGAGFTLQSLNPDLSFIGDFAGAYFSTPETMQSGGHDPTATGFTLQQLELSASKSVDPYFRFDANIVFHLDGVEVEEAYATTLALPHQLQMRAGQFLTRFGRLNSTHPHTWTFVDQPFAVGRVLGADGNRNPGAEVSWLAPLPWYVEFVGSVNDAHGAEVAPSFYGDVPIPVRSPLDLEYVGAIKQFFAISDDVSLLWGLSVANGPNPFGHNTHTDIYGTDIYLKYRPISEPANPTIISLQAEAFYRRRQVPNDVLQDFNSYAEVFWRFEPRWGVAARYETGTPAYGLDGHVAIDPENPEWVKIRHRVTANTTFWPTEFSRLRFQGAVDVPRWRDDPIYSLMLQFEIAVGAHGAHKF